MDSTKSTKIVKKKNNSPQLLILLVFISVLPLYGLYLHSPTTNPQSVTYNNFQQDFETANALFQASLHSESNQALWVLFSQDISVKDKLMVLELIRRNSRKSNRLGELLKALYYIQAYDPNEESLKYQKELFDTLNKIGREKDANLYLQAKSGLKKQLVNSGSSQLVIASVENEEVYQAELDRFIQENPQFKEKKSEGLVQLIIRRILKKKSLDLLNESEFQKKVDNLVEEMRITEFLKRELSTQEPTEVELRSFYELKKSDYNHDAGVRLLHMMLHDTDEQALLRLATNPPSSKKDFEEMVNKMSRSLSKVRNGAISEWVVNDNLPNEGDFEGLWDFLQKSSKGFNGPFKSRRGSHYFWILEKRDASSRSYEQVSKELRARYINERSIQIQEQYFKNLITDQKVQIFHERM